MRQNIIRIIRKITKKVDIGRLRCDPKDDSLYVSNKNESLEQNFNG